MLNEYLSSDKRVYIDYTDLHKDYFNLYWDNDIISLSVNDVKALIPILQNWLRSENRN